MKENDLLLSVIVPVYNVEQYIGRCLDSICNQTYGNLEIICVNDGSTDHSLEIIQEYAKSDSRIQIVMKENGGLVSARKAGVQKASGEYATYVDSDDWIEQNMYADMMRLCSETKADIITSGCIRDYGTHIVLEKENIRPGIYEGENLRKEIWMRMIDTETFFRSNISIHLYNKIYRKDLLKHYQCKVDDYVNVGDDAACVYPCVLNARKIAITEKCYYHYCMRANSTMGTKKADELDRYQILFRDLHNEFQAHYNEVSNIYDQFLNFRYYVLLLQCARKILRYDNGVLYPFGKISREERIIVYGAGRFGIELKDWLQENGFNVISWVDKNSGGEVEPVDTILHSGYDKILIAVLLQDIVSQIKRELAQKGNDLIKVYTVKQSLFCDDGMTLR